jgi:hypothetical protein
VADVALNGGQQQEAAMDRRIRVIEDRLWQDVPSGVIEEAKHAAKSEPTWIALQGNGHVVAMAPPGGPDTSTGDMIYIAEVTPAR